MHSTQVLSMFLVGMTLAIDAYAQLDVSVAAPQWSKGCVTSVGPPQVTFSPDHRVVTFLLQAYKADAQGPEATRLQRACRLTFELRLPEGFRAWFTGAQYGVTLIAENGGATELRLRHGVKGFWSTHWSKPRVFQRADSGTTILSVVDPPKTSCGGRRRLVVDLEVRAASPGSPAVALAEVESVDLDSGVTQSIALERC